MDKRNKMYKRTKFTLNDGKSLCHFVWCATRHCRSECEWAFKYSNSVAICLVVAICPNIQCATFAVTDEYHFVQATVFRITALGSQTPNVTWATPLAVLLARVCVCICVCLCSQCANTTENRQSKLQYKPASFVHCVQLYRIHRNDHDSLVFYFVGMFLTWSAEPSQNYSVISFFLLYWSDQLWLWCVVHHSIEVLKKKSSV